jgi:type IV pilus assembly protein PilM
VLFVHIGAANSVVVIARGGEILFVKYIDVGGKHFDEVVASQLGLEPAAATSLRRHNGDRRADQQDPEIALSIQEAIRDVVERLVQELSLCIRYHSVTFRGQPLSRAILSGGEATTTLQDTLAARLDLKCELGDPLRNCDVNLPPQRRGQWDVAAGLALREVGA